LFRGSPGELTKQVEGMIWITPETTDNAFIISTKRTNDGIENRVFSDTPPDVSARQVSPSLEDAYLWLIAQAYTH